MLWIRYSKPFAATEEIVAEITPVLTRHIVEGNPPLDFAGYRATGGYEPMRLAVETMPPNKDFSYKHLRAHET